MSRYLVPEDLQPGYYWVRFEDDKWEVAHKDENGDWFITGLQYAVDETQFEFLEGPIAAPK